MAPLFIGTKANDKHLKIMMHVKDKPYNNWVLELGFRYHLDFFALIYMLGKQSNETELTVKNKIIKLDYL